MNASTSTRSRYATVAEVTENLQMAAKRSPALLVVVDDMLRMFGDVSSEDVSKALEFFDFCQENPRVAMFLASMGVFLKEDDYGDDEEDGDDDDDDNC